MTPRLRPSAQGAPGDLPGVPWARLSRGYPGPAQGPTGSVQGSRGLSCPVRPGGRQGARENEKNEKMKEMKEMKNKMK